MRAGGMFGLGMLGIESTCAWAQSIPKSLEEGGTDKELRARKNIWTDGGAGAPTSNITFHNEIAQVFDDGLDAAITQSNPLESFRTQRKTADLEGWLHCIRYLRISEMHVLASAKAPSDLWQGAFGREY
jgi:hypothetical protein